MRRSALSVTLILLAGLAAACGKVENQDPARSLRISVASENLLGTKGSLYGGTKGSLYGGTKATLYGGDAKPTGAIGALGFSGTEKILDGTAAKVGERWETAGKFYFSSSTSLGLFAYYPSGLTLATKNSTGLTFSHTVPSAAADQSDIMLGHTTETVSKDDMDVSVTLDHALTSVTFKYGSVPASNFSVTGITISGVYASGTCTYTPAASPAFTWSGLTAGGSFTGSTSVTPSAGAGLGASATFALIPQVNFKPSIKVDYSYNGSAKSSTYTPADNISWERGSTYTYKINYSTSLSMTGGISGMSSTDVVSW